MISTYVLNVITMEKSFVVIGDDDSLEPIQFKFIKIDILSSTTPIDTTEVMIGFGMDVSILDDVNPVLVGHIVHRGGK